MSTITSEHFIDGKPVGSQSGRTFTAVEPATGADLAQVAFGEEGDVDAAVGAAARAFDERRWTSLAPAERARRMRAVAQGLIDRGDELAELEARDSGAPKTKTAGDVASAASLFEYFAQLPEQISGRTYATTDDFLVYSRREPYGVVGAIAPWNFPLLLAAWKTAPPLAAGNCIVLKMAEQTPLSTGVFAEICAEAGIPPGVVNVVQGDGSTGAALVRHPQVGKLTFTGSTEVGRRILRDAAQNITGVHLELGGKTPSVVFDDADLDQAIAGTLFTSYFNSGQICTSGARILVQEAIADEFTKRFVERAKALTVGDPLDPKTQLGPVVSRAQQDRVLGHIDSGLQEGAELLCGGAPIAGDGFFVPPTVFGGVTQDMRIAREEIFGPVATIITFTDEADALSKANDSHYGLAATLWTNDLGRTMRMSERLQAGIIWTNCPHHGQWNVPYEGHKLSGMGEDLGIESMGTFTQLKVHHVYTGEEPNAWA